MVEHFRDQALRRLKNGQSLVMHDVLILLSVGDAAYIWPAASPVEMLCRAVILRPESIRLVCGLGEISSPHELTIPLSDVTRCSPKPLPYSNAAAGASLYYVDIDVVGATYDERTNAIVRRENASSSVSVSIVAKSDKQAHDIIIGLECARTIPPSSDVPKRRRRHSIAEYIFPKKFVPA